MQAQDHAISGLPLGTLRTPEREDAFRSLQPAQLALAELDQLDSCWYRVRDHCRGCRAEQDLATPRQRTDPRAARSRGRGARRAIHDVSGRDRDAYPERFLRRPDDLRELLLQLDRGVHCGGRGWEDRERGIAFAACLDEAPSEPLDRLCHRAVVTDERVLHGVRLALQIPQEPTMSVKSRLAVVQRTGVFGSAGRLRARRG